MRFNQRPLAIAHCNLDIYHVPVYVTMQYDKIVCNFQDWMIKLLNYFSVVYGTLQVKLSTTSQKVFSSIYTVGWSEKK